jgi:hypothetical protein
MANVQVVEESLVLRMKITEDGVDYNVQFAFPADDVKKAIMTVGLGNQVLSSIPATVAKSALQVLAETKVEFAEG